MNDLKLLLQENLNKNFLWAVLSTPRDSKEASKIKVRPLLKKGELIFQVEMFRANQAFHENLGAEAACERLLEHMQNMKQMQMETRQGIYTVLVSKKGKVTVRKKCRQVPKEQGELSHDRKKRYIFEEGVPVPFLVGLGVMTAEGKVIHAKFDKFRQINRFLEFVEDILPQLPREREVTIVDFGCGKSYLTFAMYDYLHGQKGYDIRIIGLDLKREVIYKCNELARKYGYEKLTFLEGDIANYKSAETIDMVVTLHACDTATDFALAKAVEWEAGVIFSVPCCQHELNIQMKNDVLAPLMKYGLIKERFAALATDALRAQYLEREGYETQILEFIDMAHTPKNILIRAVRTGKAGKNRESIAACEKFLHVKPKLGVLLDNERDL